MRILYFSQFYRPESIAAAFRAEENARLWVEAGQTVTVFTGYPNFPKGKIFDGYTPRLLSEEMADGVRILRSKLWARSNTTMAARALSALSFFFFGLVNLVFNRKKIGKDYDIVLGTSGIIFAAVLGWIYAAVHRLPFVFELRDISYVQMQTTGRSPKSIAVRLMRWMELFLCRKAKQIVVVTNGFRNTLAEDGIPAEKITVITNGVDVPAAAGTDDPRFVLSYFGTLGISQNISATFPYAQVLKDACQEFTYLIIGDGAQERMIQQELAGGEYPFIQKMPGMDAKSLEQYYGCTQLSVVTLKKTESFRDTIPSKLFQIMGRGIAVLFIGPEGEAAQIVRRYDAGIALTGTVSQDLEKLRAFFSQPDWERELKRMGENGRAAVLVDYSRRRLAKQYLELLTQQVCANGKA